MSLEIDPNLLANPLQEFLVHTAFWLNTPARDAVARFERLVYAPHQKKGWSLLAKKTQDLAKLCFLSFQAGLAFCFSTPCYVLASLVGSGRLKVVHPEISPQKTTSKTIQVMCNNATFQDPYSILTGGVERPLEGKPLTRVEKIVQKIVEANVDVFVGQEFESLSAQKAFVDHMQRRGYSCVIDLGCDNPFLNSSGICIASRIPLKKVEFVPCKWANREGMLGKGSRQGYLACTVQLGDKDLKIIGIHLNYGGDPYQEVRKRQLEEHIAPLLTEYSVVLGDANFSTQRHSISRYRGFESYENKTEGTVTCTNQPKLNRQNKPGPLQEESIDVLIYNPAKTNVTNVNVGPVQDSRGKFLTDHFAISATLELQDS